MCMFVCPCLGPMIYDNEQHVQGVAHLSLDGRRDPELNWEGLENGLILKIIYHKYIQMKYKYTSKKFTKT